MSTPYEIPLSPEPQLFEIALAGVTYKMVVTWNVFAGCWMLDIMKPDLTLIVGGIALVTGADLLEQYGYLNFGGQLIVQTDHNTDAVPTLANLGVEGRAYFVVED